MGQRPSLETAIAKQILAGHDVTEITVTVEAIVDTNGMGKLKVPLVVRLSPAELRSDAVMESFENKLQKAIADFRYIAPWSNVGTNPYLNNGTYLYTNTNAYNQGYNQGNPYSSQGNTYGGNPYGYQGGSNSYQYQGSTSATNTFNTFLRECFQAKRSRK